MKTVYLAAVYKDGIVIESELERVAIFSRLHTYGDLAATDFWNRPEKEDFRAGQREVGSSQRVWKPSQVAAVVLPFLL